MEQQTQGKRRHGSEWQRTADCKTVSLRSRSFVDVHDGTISACRSLATFMVAQHRSPPFAGVGVTIGVTTGVTTGVTIGVTIGVKLVSAYGMAEDARDR